MCIRDSTPTPKHPAQQPSPHEMSGDKRVRDVHARGGRGKWPMAGGMDWGGQGNLTRTQHVMGKDPSRNPQAPEHSPRKEKWRG
eukprot:8077781-Alexandrium_andersonii.AAC.1